LILKINHGRQRSNKYEILLKGYYLSLDPRNFSSQINKATSTATDTKIYRINTREIDLDYKKTP
jgi:hypothetical protein